MVIPFTAFGIAVFVLCAFGIVLRKKLNAKLEQGQDPAHPQKAA